MLLFSDRHRGPLDAAPFSSSGEPSKAPRSLRIIVADDDRDMVLSLMMLLRDEGHDVQGFHSGRQVMRAVIDFNPDVAVLDINLPEVSGWRPTSTLQAFVSREQLSQQGRHHDLDSNQRNFPRYRLPAVQPVLKLELRYA